MEECGDDTTTEQACLSSHDIFGDPSLLTFYQNNDFTPWGNLVRSEEKGEGPNFKVRSTFEDDLGHFTLEKSLQLKGLDNLITSQQNDWRTKFAELNATLDCLGKPQVDKKDPLLAITTCSPYFESMKCFSKSYKQNSYRKQDRLSHFISN